MKKLIKLYLSLVYEALLMFALVLVLTALYYSVFGDANHGLKRVALQTLLWLSMGAYFVRCWTTSGQTVACQAWHLKVVSQQAVGLQAENQENSTLNLIQALKRYILASILTLPAGLTFWWALFDKEHCFLHDRLLNTRIQLLD